MGARAAHRRRAQTFAAERARCVAARVGTVGAMMREVIPGYWVRVSKITCMRVTLSGALRVYFDQDSTPLEVPCDSYEMALEKARVLGRPLEPGDPYR